MKINKKLQKQKSEMGKPIKIPVNIYTDGIIIIFRYLKMLFGTQTTGPGRWGKTEFSDFDLGKNRKMKKWWSNHLDGINRRVIIGHCRVFSSRDNCSSSKVSFVKSLLRYLFKRKKTFLTKDTFWRKTLYFLVFFVKSFVRQIFTKNFDERNFDERNFWRTKLLTNYDPPLVHTVNVQPDGLIFAG